MEWKRKKKERTIRLFVNIWCFLIFFDCVYCGGDVRDLGRAVGVSEGCVIKRKKIDRT